MAYDEDVANRVRQAVAAHTGLSERKMFGGLCLMVNGNMFAGIRGDELMLRVGQERFEQLLAKPGARPMDFTGRPMNGMVFREGCGLSRRQSARGVGQARRGPRGVAAAQVGPPWPLS